jgi:uncharacterized membrane protein
VSRPPLVYCPLARPFLIAVVLAAVLMVALLQVGVVGGALVPAALSGYLIVHDHLGWRALAAVALVAVLVHAVARPVQGLGIAVPTLLPGVFAAGAAVLLHPVALAGLAYVSGTLGTLIGADLTNLSKVRQLGAPVASIGGAGTFDGVFLTGIIAVLLAGLA